MKNLFKRFTAFLAAVLIFCISVVPSFVSADSVDIVKRSSGISDSLISSYLDQFYNNESVINLGYTRSNSLFFMCDYHYESSAYILCLKSSDIINDSSLAFWYNGGYNKIYPWFSSSQSIFARLPSLSVLSSYNFSESSYDFSGSFPSVVEVDGFLYFCNVYSSSDTRNPTGFSTNDKPPYTCNWYFLSPAEFIGPSQPDSSGKLTLTGVRLGVDKKGFLDWLITEGKDSVINSTGFSFTQTQLSLLVDVFDSYGNSLFPFYSSLVKTFKLTQHSLTGASALLSTLQELYRDYIDYKNSIEIVEITPDDSAKPHWRQDKTDNTLVTDQDDDTSVVSILREILRTLIYLPSSIRSSFSDLATNIVSIMYNWNRLFDKLDYISPDISGDVDRLIDAINNISVDVPDTSVDVTITDEKQQELDDFFNGWSVDFDNKVKEKFPVTAQLGELFNDDFFEKCGIDCNGDGEVYSYYSENVYAVSVVSTVSELSAFAPGSDQKLVSDFIGQFDSADVNFLNDANFSSSVPDWSITVGGKKCEVFSFKLYAKYRTQIHFIISFILWTVYLLSLYKSLPSIIGQVSDVVHGIEKM